MEKLKDLWLLEPQNISDGQQFTIDNMYEKSDVKNMVYQWDIGCNRALADGFNYIDITVEPDEQGIGKGNGCFKLISYDRDNITFIVDTSQQEQKPNYNIPSNVDYSNINQNYNLKLPDINDIHISFAMPNNEVNHKCIGTIYDGQIGNINYDNGTYGNEINECDTCPNSMFDTVDFFGDGKGKYLWKFEDTLDSEPSGLSWTGNATYVNEGLDKSVSTTSKIEIENFNPFNKAYATFTFWTKVNGKNNGLFLGDVNQLFTKINVDGINKFYAKLSQGCYEICDFIDGWIHVAIVKAGRYTTYYVNGKKVRWLNVVPTANEANWIKFVKTDDNSDYLDNVRFIDRMITEFEVMCIYSTESHKILGNI